MKLPPEAFAPPFLRTAGRMRLGQIPIDRLTFAEALDAIEGLVLAGHGGTVFTPNVDHVVLAEEDERFRLAYRQTDLSLVDGVPVVWASRLFGPRLPERVAGSDLMRPLAARAAKKGWRVYLLGAAPGVAQRVKVILERDYPGINVVGTGSPNIDIGKEVADQQAIVEDVRAARPDILFLALGAPKQEIWAYRVRQLLKPAVIIGVGATFDFIAGNAKRAPPWVGAAGFEWLYRLVHDPRRLWKRYLVRDPKFLVILARQIRSNGRGSSQPRMR
ncbi:MAG TPA: WecB/TagA/CpsF family glycosyltransferase [Polyangiaceae bacterium]|jgi:N-acetylglucosaminyldiphosphoundecaprenol N-acetyl-beta-D-mannosaminyltransferase|nr:WecB/TagA/CpsF family glycosyltransferase [Polyangiaceae bacterium]